MPLPATTTPSEALAETADAALHLVDRPAAALLLEDPTSAACTWGTARKVREGQQQLREGVAPDEVRWTKPATGPPVYVIDAVLEDVDPVLVGAAVKEFDVGGLAGPLIDFERLRVDLTKELIAYTTRFPWPLQARTFEVEHRFGTSHDSMWLLGRDVADIADVDELNSDWMTDYRNETARFRGSAHRGRVHGTAYRVVPLGPKRCRLVRTLSIEMMLPIPHMFLDGILAQRLLDDVDLLRSALAKPSVVADLEKRIEADPLYLAWRALVVQKASTTSSPVS